MYFLQYWENSDNLEGRNSTLFYSLFFVIYNDSKNAKDPTVMTSL